MRRIPVIALTILCIFAFSIAEVSAQTSSSGSGWVTGGKEGPERIKKVWNDMYKAKFKKDETGCMFDYGPQGMKNLYCYISSIVSYQALVDIAGIDPFLEGPHSKDALVLDSKYSFGHYNPDFVKWLSDNLIPGATDEEFKWVSEPVYNKYFKGTAKIYYLVYFKMHEYPDFFEKEVKKFLTGLQNHTLNEYWYTEYWDLFDDNFFKMEFDGDFYWANVAAAAGGFWIRRYVDGTDQAFLAGLEKLVKTYDPETYDRVTASSSKSMGDGRTLSQRVLFQAPDRLLMSFLDQLTNAIEAHDWETALTFFDPQNYLGQMEMGIKTPQYIEEGLGLGMVNNKLIPKTGDGSEWTRLNSISTIELTSVNMNDDAGITTIKGQVTLFDGSKRNVELYLIQRPTGGWLLAPAVG